MKLEEHMTILSKNLSEFACLDESAIRFNDEIEDIRTPFFRDIDKILYTLSFNRYKDKTQVFTFQKHDHITKRITHVLYVSKIARTIGRVLGLNEDLIEAAALGHDLGHVPFGHVGERCLNKISLENNEGFFNHNVMSVRLLMNVEKYGKGSNVTLQTLDAIMCHNGEIPLGKYIPQNKTKEQFLEEYNNTYKDKLQIVKLVPMTLEGCVVRISDLIAYLGRDVEDGIRLGLISENDIPPSVSKVLGTKNKDIINTIINDIIRNSYNQNYIKLSDDVFKAINELKKFNYQNIYYKAYTDQELEKIENMFRVLFETYINDLKNNNMQSNINKSFLSNMCSEYKKNTFERIVIDYIAGMTDDYFLKEYNKITESEHNK